MLQLGERLKRYMQGNGITQEELFTCCDIPKSSFGFYLHGVRVPNVRVLHRIAEATTIPFEELSDLAEQDRNTLRQNRKELSDNLLYNKQAKELTPIAPKDSPFFFGGNDKPKPEVPAMWHKDDGAIPFVMLKSLLLQSIDEEDFFAAFGKGVIKYMAEKWAG